LIPDRSGQLCGGRSAGHRRAPARSRRACLPARSSRSCQEWSSSSLSRARHGPGSKRPAWWACSTNMMSSGRGRFGRWLRVVDRRGVQRSGTVVQSAVTAAPAVWWLPAAARAARRPRAWPVGMVLDLGGPWLVHASTTAIPTEQALPATMGARRRTGRGCQRQEVRSSWARLAAAGSGQRLGAPDLDTDQHPGRCSRVLSTRHHAAFALGLTAADGVQPGCAVFTPDGCPKDPPGQRSQVIGARGSGT
jgi:hypothetical protein